MRMPPDVKDGQLFFGDDKWHRTRHAAYYAIARRMVIDRFPDDLRAYATGQYVQIDESELTVADSMGISVSQLRSRSRRVIDLFVTTIPSSYDEVGGQYFDGQRWSALIRRLVRFLKFVDARREESAMSARSLELLAATEAPKKRRQKAPRCPGCASPLRKNAGRPDPLIGSIEWATHDGYGHDGSGFCTARCGLRYAVAVLREAPETTTILNAQMQAFREENPGRRLAERRPSRAVAVAAVRSEGGAA